METPAQTAARLLASLDELTGQEGIYLRGGYYDLAVETRRRAAPLVRLLNDMAGQPGLEELRSPVTALLEQSERHAAFLREKLEALGAEIRRIDRARYRLAQVAPVYAQSLAGEIPNFQAAG